MKLPKLTAKRFSIRVRDFLKGMLMAVGTAVGLYLQSAADGGVALTWKPVAMAALAAAVTYICRKFLVDDVKIARKTLKENEHEKH